MLFPTTKLVNNEEKSAIIQISILNPPGGYERTLEFQWPKHGTYGWN